MELARCAAGGAACWPRGATCSSPAYCLSLLGMISCVACVGLRLSDSEKDSLPGWQEQRERSVTVSGRSKGGRKGDGHSRKQGVYVLLASRPLALPVGQASSRGRGHAALQRLPPALPRALVAALGGAGGKGGQLLQPQPHRAPVPRVGACLCGQSRAGAARVDGSAEGLAFHALAAPAAGASAYQAGGAPL